MIRFVFHPAVALDSGVGFVPLIRVERDGKPVGSRFGNVAGPFETFAEAEAHAIQAAGRASRELLAQFAPGTLDVTVRMPAVRQQALAEARTVDATPSILARLAAGFVRALLGRAPAPAIAQQ